MTTIPEIISQISNDIQNAFEELIKLLLRKTLRPNLNPLGSNTRVVYNTCMNRFERGYLGATPDDNISKYSYFLTNDCMGWVENNITNFKAYPRFSRNNYPYRYPQGPTKIHNLLLTKNQVAYAPNEKIDALNSGRIIPLSNYKNFIRYLTTRS